jgi:hypothetical protein
MRRILLAYVFEEISISGSAAADLAGDSSSASGTQSYVAAAFVITADDTLAASATTSLSGSAVASTGDDASLAFGTAEFLAASFAIAGDDASAALGLTGGYGGAVFSQLGGDTLASAAGQGFAGSGSPTTGSDASSAYSVPFQSPIEILWEDGPTILWETSDVVEWDELWVIPGVIAAIAGPAGASAAGDHDPPPSVTGTIAATLGSAAAGPATSGVLKFVGVASGLSIADAGGSASGVVSASDFVGRVIGLAGNDYSTAFGLLKFVGAITGQTGATGQILGPLIPIDGDGGTVIDDADIFHDIDACTLEAVATQMDFVGYSSDYDFVAQACGACT